MKENPYKYPEDLKLPLYMSNTITKYIKIKTNEQICLHKNVNVDFDVKAYGTVKT